MAAWLVGARGRDGRYRNTQEAAFALSAMVEVVRTREKETPDFVGTVKLGEKTLAEVPFRGRSLERVQRTVPIAELGRGEAAVPFEFRRDGTSGVLYYGAVLLYAPEKMPTDSLDRGIFVQRWFEPYEGGGQVRTVRAGELVRVRVRVGTPQARRDVAVEVAVPSGLEIVDTSLASTASLPRVRGEPDRDPDSIDDGGGGGNPGGAPDFARGYWTPFDHVERRDDRLVLFADRLPAGIHETSFVARATLPGRFVSRPASWCTRRTARSGRPRWAPRSPVSPSRGTRGGRWRSSPARRARSASGSGPRRPGRPCSGSRWPEAARPTASSNGSRSCSPWSGRRWRCPETRAPSGARGSFPPPACAPTWEGSG
jgi:hypothetical protein